MLLGNSDPTVGFSIGCDGTDSTAVCGIPYFGYLFNPATRYVVGEFQNEEGANADDILIISGVETNPLRSLLMGKDSNGFILKCNGINDGACGLDKEGYMRHSGTEYTVGDFNGDSRDDVSVISGDQSQPRRRVYVGTDLIDGSFQTGCYGDTDGSCGFDSNPYMFHSNTRIL
jgi:hypothetical protein